MGWKDWPYWLKGGIILLILSSIFFVYGPILLIASISLDREDINALEDKLLPGNDFLFFVIVALIELVIIFFIEALIGFI